MESYFVYFRHVICLICFCLFSLSPSPTPWHIESEPGSVDFIKIVTFHRKQKLKASLRLIFPKVMMLMLTMISLCKS